MLTRTLVIAFTLLILPACGTQVLRDSVLQSTYIEGQDELAECAKVFARIDRQVREAGATDAQSARIAGFPYLRTDRLLASFSDTISAQMLPDWFAQMRELDRQARHYELKNAAISDNEPQLERKLDECAADLMYADRQNPLQVEKLKQASVVADSYMQAKRILGLYPITRLFVSAGVKRLQKRIKATFSGSIETLSSGKLLSISPQPQPRSSSADIAGLIRSSTKNGLGLPLFEKSDEEKLFSHFAPVWQLEVRDGNDLFGVPVWSDDGNIVVQTAEPQVYQHLSFVRLDNTVLPQFNYIIWFPARPAKSGFDILSGKLDGITWRVTVGLDGKPLIYDAMHNCGCYHMFFPVENEAIHIKNSDDNEEPILVPRRAPDLQENERIHLRIASGSHYLEGLQAAVAGTDYQHYGVVDYNELRSLTLKNGKQKSMFAADGIVPGSSRKERWLLWPMGIKDAGAMRQWGQHATAFVGRRHFDDADLLQRFFSFP